MRSSYKLKKTIKIRGRSSWLPFLLFTLMAVAGFLNPATAQRNNLSDWAVPPPLPPGNITKGDATGKPATGKSPVLTITDIPAISLPQTSGVQLPLLAAISTTPPAVNTPDQPTISGIVGLPEIPMPGTPESPNMPERTLQDAQTPQVVDLPMPASPDLPPLPAEPTASGSANNEKGIYPVMPDVVSSSISGLPLSGALLPWSTPGIPENVTFKLIMPGDTKGGRYGGKGTPKAKPRPHRN
jgi:hypothetical protein